MQSPFFLPPRVPALSPFLTPHSLVHRSLPSPLICPSLCLLPPPLHPRPLLTFSFPHTRRMSKLTFLPPALPHIPRSSPLSLSLPRSLSPSLHSSFLYASLPPPAAVGGTYHSHIPSPTTMPRPDAQKQLARAAAYAYAGQRKLLSTAALESTDLAKKRVSKRCSIGFKAISYN